MPNDISYQEYIQKQLAEYTNHFEKFKSKCLEQQAITDQKIAALDKANPQFKEQEIDLKVELKNLLDQMLKQFELEMRRSFGDNLSALEEKYNQNNQHKLEQLEESLKFV